MNGPEVRTDLVLAVAYAESPVRWLQVRRAEGSMAGQWHPVMGHIEPGETATAAVRRELGEELGLKTDYELWQLDGIQPFFLASPNEIYLAPAFAVRVGDSFAPMLNDEHTAWRWVQDPDAEHSFVWPFQLAAIAEARRYVLTGAPAAGVLRQG